MEQHEFIWMGNKLGVQVIQGEGGITSIQLRPKIVVSHNYKKKNLTQVVFIEDGAKYNIGSKYELESVIALHLSNEHLETVLRSFCEKNLEKA